MKTRTEKLTREFSISLESNPTTGYMWNVKYDAAFLRLKEKKYIAMDGQIGGGGLERFLFVPIEVGETVVTFNYKRKWEEKSIKEMQLQIVIVDE